MPQIVFALQSASEVIAVLGGPAKAGRIVGKSVQSMSNAANLYCRLPRDTYLVLTRRLKRLGYSAPASLWGMPDKPAKRTRRNAGAADGRASPGLPG